MREMRETQGDGERRRATGRRRDEEEERCRVIDMSAATLDQNTKNEEPHEHNGNAKRRKGGARQIGRAHV